MSRRDGIRASAVAAAAALAVALAGCGLGAGSTPSQVSLLVTRGFGAQTILATSTPRVVGADTVMRMLERNARVGTRYGGGFVQSIDRISGGGGSDWFYYVNGVEAQKGAAATKLHDGDHVWWDRHDWSAAESVPAVVGSFPEPFVDGYGGKRLPLRIECTEKSRTTCNRIQNVFAGYDLVASEGCLLCSQYNESLRVVVGPFRDALRRPRGGTPREGPAGERRVRALRGRRQPPRLLDDGREGRAQRGRRCRA